MDADFAASFPGAAQAGERAALAADVREMLRAPLPSLALNGPLVAEVREILTRRRSPTISIPASSTVAVARVAAGMDGVGQRRPRR